MSCNPSREAVRALYFRSHSSASSFCLASSSLRELKPFRTEANLPIEIGQISLVQSRDPRIEFEGICG